MSCATHAARCSAGISSTNFRVEHTEADRIGTYEPPLESRASDSSSLQVASSAAAASAAFGVLRVQGRILSGFFRRIRRRLVAVVDRLEQQRQQRELFERIIDESNSCPGS